MFSQTLSTTDFLQTLAAVDIARHCSRIHGGLFLVCIMAIEPTPDTSICMSCPARWLSRAFQLEDRGHHYGYSREVGLFFRKLLSITRVT